MSRTSSPSSKLEQRSPDWSFELAARQQGYEAIAGIDEAGRGPWAGAVIAGAVVFPEGFELPSELSVLNDSKKLNRQKRVALFEALTSHEEIAWGVGESDAKEIDQVNILQATYLAMKRAYQNLSFKGAPLTCDYLLVDGNKMPGKEVPGEPVVKGDSRSISIAAASIIAKETRDLQMEEAEKKYPGYGFAQHKGYGTKVHLEALRERGPCPIHRMTFGFLKQQTLDL